MKEDKKVILGVLKKNIEREDKFENLVLNLALKKMAGAKKDERGVYYSKGGKRVLMASKTLEGDYAIKDGTQEVDDNAFWGCVFLKNVVIPESVESIGDGAFGRCISLEELRIPASVGKLGRNPFEDLQGDVVKCESANYVVEAKILYTSDKTTVVSCLSDAAMCIIPKTVTNIDDKAFTRRRRLKKVVIPEGVKRIGADAFSDCDSLEEVSIPASVETIDSYAFAECDSLRKVTLFGAVKRISRTAFSDCDSLASISVPAGCAAKVRKQLHLSDYSEVIVLEREDAAPNAQNANDAAAEEPAAKEKEGKKDKPAKKDASKKKSKKEDAEPTPEAPESEKQDTNN